MKTLNVTLKKAYHKSRVQNPSVDDYVASGNDYLGAIKLGLYLSETSLVFNETKGMRDVVNAYRGSKRTYLQKAFPGYYKGASKSVTGTLNVLKITNAVGKGLARPFFFAGLGLSAFDIATDPSLGNIGWNLADVGVGAAALVFAASPAGWVVGAGAAVYFTGRLAYDLYGIYNEEQ